MKGDCLAILCTFFAYATADLCPWPYAWKAHADEALAQTSLAWGWFCLPSLSLQMLPRGH